MASDIQPFQQQQPSSIRPATQEDALAIKHIAASLGYPDYDESLAESRLQALLNSSNDQVWICERDGMVVGWLHAFIALRDAFAEIGGLAVEPAFRRQGVGRALVQQAKHWAADQQLAVRVRSRIERAEARRFYRAQGLIPSKQQQVFEQFGE
ncbi:GNAT family N-acetyltransferase [Motiliproteus sp.]|uniref:GNAT family N-acetyltransferase n=1 Tax=Motiliproteus sp. TaxID=1898955 RepID=UPI003BA8585C